MEIPVTDKLWVKCKFDENFNEISYIDNRGNSYEYSNPITGHLKYYKNNDIDISQELLDNIKHIKSDDKDEQLFIDYFSDLKLIIRNSTSNGDHLLFVNKRDDKLYVKFYLNFGYYYIVNENMRTNFLILDSNFLTLKILMEKFFKIKNAMLY